MIRADKSVSSTGICIAASGKAALPEAVAELELQLDAGKFQHIIVFFSPNHDATELSAPLKADFPDVRITGCSTAGEITPNGMMVGGIVLIAFPHEGFNITQA